MNINKESEKVTDLDYLTQLSKGNKLFVKEMIEIFLEENPEEIRSLAKDIADRNYDVIKASAHKLKSTIPFVGLDRILDKDVEELEALAVAKSEVSEMEKRFSKIKQVCEQACLELRPAYPDVNAKAAAVDGHKKDI